MCKFVRDVLRSLCKAKCVVFSLAIGFLMIGVAHAGDSVATVSLMEKAPKIDGKMTEGEWDTAVRTEPLMGWRRMKLEPRHATVWMGYTKKNLYVAIESELRPTGLIAKKKMDDGRLIFDSVVEMAIDPNRDNRASGKGDLSYYQFMANSIGTTKDVQHGLGASNTGWDSGVKIGNSIDEKRGVWVAEYAFPWKSFGIKSAELPGKNIGLVVARDFKNPWSQPTWMPQGAAFASVTEFPVVRLTDNEPVVRIENLKHDTFMGESPLQLKVVNPGPARKVKIDMLITSTDMPKLEKTETLDLPAGGSATFDYKVTRGRLHKRATHTLNLVVTDLKTNTVLFRHKGGQWKAPPKKKWRVRTGPNPAAAAKVGYYPSKKIFKAWITPVELGNEFAKTRSANIKVTDSAGDEIMSKTFTWDKGNTGIAKYTLPDISDGLYTATIQIKGFDEAMVRHFEDRTFPWEDNTLGLTNEIYPPFEPVEQDGNDVKVVMRKYKMNGLGLWDSVQARGNETDYKELLAGPMTVKLSMKSDAVDAKGQALEGLGGVVSAKKHSVVYQGAAEHDAVRLKTRTITEYDGCMRVEMDLMPGVQEKEIKSLWVDIPIRDELAPLFHTTTTALRSNPAGQTPDGKGLFWDTRDFPDGEWPTGFRPYIWLGAEERGLCWFADNDKNWVKYVNYEKGEYAPAFSMHRNEGVLTLRIHLVQRPVTLQRKRHIVFGLMATPAKPMPENWRAIGRPERDNFYFSMGHVHGLYHTYASKYPLNYDWSTFDLNYARRTGQKLERSAKEIVQAWRERNLTDNIPKSAREKIGHLVGLGYRRNPRGPMSVYFEEFHSTRVKGGAEAPAYYTEWTGKPLREGFFSDPPPWAIHMSTGALVDSYRDFACWYAAEWLKRGYGIYFDNSFPKRSMDQLTTAAYKWKGRIVPSAGMWNHRKYLKRIWIMHQKMRDPKAPQAMMIHMTNTHIAPYMVWNEYNLDLEWRGGKDKLQKRFATDLIRTESLGLKTGNVPVVLGFSGGPAMLVHEIKSGITVKDYPEPFVKFGYGKPDCKVYNYWDEKPPMEVSDPYCKWLLLKRDGKLLVYLVTWNGEENEVKITLALQCLGLTTHRGRRTTVSRVVDAKTSKLLGELKKDHSFTINMEGYGVRVLRVE
ncbi:MAG: glycoside hydrolase domain-containing protein [Candidatus Brocadiia bacterium]